MKKVNFKGMILGVSIVLSMMLMNMSCTTASSEDKQQRTEEVAKVPDMSIHEAAFMGDINQIKQHIAAGSDLNAMDEYGSTPLGIAATFNKPKVAEALIKGGANVNVRGMDGSTPLHTAAFFCRKDIVKMLLDGGVDSSVRNNYGSTALESITGPFADVRPVYDQMSRDLGPLGFKIDYDYIQETRPVIAEMIRTNK